jgi:predicted NUDIX family NTP pyrophosphohydrolase
MRISAGILAFRQTKAGFEVFLVHPGGPFWKNKENGAWSLPKGELSEGENPLSAAQREFEEETGQKIKGEFIELKPVKLKSGKLVMAWAIEANPDASNIISNTIRLEWPYKSGRWITCPEVDKAAWFGCEEAKQKVNPAQSVFVDELGELLKTMKK